MFDVGFTELMLIGVVALVVIGPERLPAVARSAGRWINKMQRFVKGVKTDLASELETGDLKQLIGDQREQIDELRKMVNTARQDFEAGSKEVVQDARKSLESLEEASKDAGKEAGKETSKSEASTRPDESVTQSIAEGSQQDSSSSRQQDSQQSTGQSGTETSR